MRVGCFMIKFLFRAFILWIIALSFTAISGRAQGSEEAYFVFRYPPRTSTFIFKLTDPAKIQEARNIVATHASKVVSGTIVKQPVYYNPGWNFHFDPKTISFPDIAVEICDSTMEDIEADLDNAWPQWCPWKGEVLAEISPLPRLGRGNLNPTVSV